MFSDICVFLIHDYELVTADRAPFPQLHAAKPRPDLFLRKRVDRKIKLAVVEHLGPKRAVDKICKQFQKHPVHIFGNGFANLSSVDDRLYRIRRLCRNIYGSPCRLNI